MDVARTEAAKRFADDAPSQIGPIAVAAEVAKNEVTQFRGDDLFGDLCRRVVREMAVAAENALLGGPRATSVVLKHFHVVVGFEHERMGGADAFDDEFRGVAEVGEETNVPGCGAQEEPNRIVRIVRHAESINPDVS